MSATSRGSVPERWGATRSSRDALLADRSLTGSAFAAAHAELVDSWLRQLLGEEPGVAVVAVGGYGRCELAPQSDVDVLLVERTKTDPEVANRLWYPLWDAGVPLGHAVRTVKEALSLASNDLNTATALLDARFVAGDEALAAELREGATRQWRARAKQNLGRLSASVRDRHERFGEVAFLLEPDLKEGAGGLRDAHALAWARAAGAETISAEAIEASYEVLLRARVELHRATGRPGNQLVLQEQDAVAAAVGVADADELMARIAASARLISWWSDESWRRVDSSPRGRGLVGVRRGTRALAVDTGVEIRDGAVALAADADLADPTLVLRVALAAAESSVPVETTTLERLAAEGVALPEPWPERARHALVSLLGSGHAAVSVLEALDQFGLLVRLVPEWEGVRHRPQRNAYHRFTVDRHLCEAAANAATLTRNVARPDLLLVGAWLHDIGKGFPGDHTEVGQRVVARIATRLGFVTEDVETLVAMVRHHLLLPDVATRRDLDDPATVASVAAAVGDLRTLELLDALTEADSIATGPSAWGDWKAGLVRDLVSRTARALEGHVSDTTVSTLTDADRALMAKRRFAMRKEDGRVTVVAPDRPGLFARVAGTLALHGLDIFSATAAGEDGMAVETFRVEPSFGREPDWEQLAADLERAHAGRLAIEARLEERMRTYAGPRATTASRAEPRVLFDNEASELATVIEVRASDAIGVLYRITRALADCDVDVRSAKVQTLGQEVVDSFYVRDSSGRKIDDRAYLAEIERAVLGALRRTEAPR